MPSTIIDLATIKRQRALAHSATPIISLREIDPENVNRSFYFIMSRDVEAVRTEIAYLVAQVESFGSGSGSFDKPHRFNGYFFTVGEVEVFP